MYILHFLPLPPPFLTVGPGWKQYFFHYELSITMIFFPYFLLILVMKNKYLITRSLKLSEKDKNKSKKFRCAPRAIIDYKLPLKLMAQPHRGHISTFQLKKSLEISMHLGGKDINSGFGGGGTFILCKIYTPVKILSAITVLCRRNYLWQKMSVIL